MDNLLVQLPALIGVTLGVIGTLATTMVTDAARWRRERFYDACLQYTRALRRYSQLIAGMTAGHRPGATTPPVDLDAGLARLTGEEIDRAVTDAWEELCLLADADTVDAARRMRVAAHRLEVFARAGDDAEFDLDGWDGQALLLRRARDDFYAAARSRMGVRRLSTSSSLIHRDGGSGSRRR
ncbi:hypothetical protein GCM10010413_34270 [Promicromonospora sukumoe]|uniref:Uncharacterized protein n=1 Tax=Promicromonospora sukumoe TaxID=88382 RepID=A0A7W3PDB6_9MICO|nr:hypothetical protein [Promicromonospora sukumoe]MBA8807372.1 hypothetical protein [Promicromonospora sukumoe]